jgi:hypothetical protein
VHFIYGCPKGIGDAVWSAVAPIEIATVFFLLTGGDRPRSQSPGPAPANINRLVIYNGASRFVSYQAPPDISPPARALYSALAGAENDQFLADQLQQLLVEYTEQERILGWVRTSHQLLQGGRGAGGPGGFDSGKGQNVHALVQAAEARSRFASQVNRDLEQLRLKLTDYRDLRSSTGSPDDRNALQKQVSGPVQIFWGNSRWPGEIKDKKNRLYLIHYTGWDASWDEWVTGDRIRVSKAQGPAFPGGALRVGLPD